jgi:hypothetical protein
MNETTSRNEVKEFHELLNDWKHCAEFNLLNGNKHILASVY